MIVYLCGGINGLLDADATDWREWAKAHLIGAETLDPMRRDYRGIEDQNVEAIVHGDIDDIRHSDVLLVNAMRPSWGTAMEIVIAHGMEKTIYSVCPGRVSPWLRYHSTEILSSFEEAVARVNGNL